MKKATPDDFYRVIKEQSNQCIGTLLNFDQATNLALNLKLHTNFTYKLEHVKDGVIIKTIK